REAPRVKERRQTCSDGVLPSSILISAHLGVGRREDRVSHELIIAPGAASQGSVKCLHGFGVALEEIIRHTDVQSCPDVGAIETQRSFEPRQGLSGSSCKYQNNSTIGIAIRIAWIVFKSPVNLSECEIEVSSVQIYGSE